MVGVRRAPIESATATTSSFEQELEVIRACSFGRLSVSSRGAIDLATRPIVDTVLSVGQLACITRSLARTYPGNCTSTVVPCRAAALSKPPPLKPAGPHLALGFLTTTITPPPHAPPHSLLLTYPVLADCCISRETSTVSQTLQANRKLDVSWRQLSKFHDSALEPCRTEY
jgi:hypothetical protein